MLVNASGSEAAGLCPQPNTTNVFNVVSICLTLVVLSWHITAGRW